MKVKARNPTAPLNRYIDSIVYLEGNNKGAGLPKAAMSLVFNLEDGFKLFNDASFTRSVNYAKFWIGGLQLEPRYVESHGISKMIVVQFRTFGAAAFLPGPLRCFTNSYVSLDDVFSRDASETWEKIQEAQTLDQKFGVVERFLVRQLKEERSARAAVLEARAATLPSGTTRPVHAMCAAMQISRKHLNHLFKESVGISPKSFFLLHRFNKALVRLTQPSSDTLTGIAYDAEFFDQAHFTTEFKRWSGLTPSQYRSVALAVPSLEKTPHFLPAQP